MQHILFVCRGNTCRSPMAEGLARRLLGDQVYVDSAGITPGGEVTREAVDALARQYGVDISAHRPQSVNTLALDSFDAIVALDETIYAYLISSYPQSRERLLMWRVSDPYGNGPADYSRALEEIEQELRALAADLGLKENGQ